MYIVGIRFSVGTLIQERRSGAVATLAASRGTSCSVDVAESVVRRIHFGSNDCVILSHF